MHQVVVDMPPTHYEEKKSVASMSRAIGDQLMTHCSLVDESFCDRVFEISEPHIAIKGSSHSKDKENDS